MEKRFILIEDTTLREGEQTPGISFNERQKRNIIEGLAQAGVKYIEVGIPVMGSVEFKAIKKIAAEKDMPTLIGWNRGIKEDLDRTFEAGLTALHIGLPSSDVHIKQKFGADYNWVIETAVSLVEYAKSQGATFISVSAEDMGRANIDFLKSYAKSLEQAGVTRMRLSDTVGCLTPIKTTAIVSELMKEVSHINFQMHMHNDFNLALANVMAGVDAGASQVHVTINGLGDRAGIASLHQVVVALELLGGYSTAINMKELCKLSSLVAEYSGLQVAANEPIVGSAVFTHESGIHVDGILKVKESFEAFEPEILGRTHDFILGKHTGSAAVQHILKEQGYMIDRNQAKQMLPFIRELSTLTNSKVDREVALLIAKHLFE